MTDFTVGAARDLPISTDAEWDGDAAKAQIFAWAGGEDFDSTKARKGFLVYDADEPSLRGSYHLPFAHVPGGTLKASPAGLRAAASRLPQTDIPQAVMDRARAVIDHYQERMDNEESMRRWRHSTRGKISPPSFVNKQAEFEVGEDRSGVFVASSAREDRMGDIIEQSWELSDFWRNPVFLWSHQSWSTPIGWVREFAPNDKATETISRVEFLPEGTDEFVDKLFRLTRLRAIRAVSVGFIPLEVEDRWDEEERHRWVGFRFLRSQLIELSLCTVPANPDALSLARMLDSHPAFLRRVCNDPALHSLAPINRGGLVAPPVAAPKLVGTFQRRAVAIETLTRLKHRVPA